MTENRRPGELFERSVSRYRQERPRRRTGRVTFEDKMTGEPAGSARSRGTCRYLKVSTWHSDTWRAIPAKSQARLLYLHLLTGPHTLAYHVPGLYQVGQHALCEAMELRRREFATAMKTLIASAGVRIDRGKGIIWVPGAMESLGPPANPNIVRGYCRALLTMPQSPLTSVAVAAYEPFLASLGTDFVQPLQEAFPALCAPCSQHEELVPPSSPVREARAPTEPSPTQATQGSRTGSLSPVGSILQSLS